MRPDQLPVSRSPMDHGTRVNGVLVRDIEAYYMPGTYDAVRRYHPLPHIEAYCRAVADLFGRHAQFISQRFESVDGRVE